MTDRTNNPAAAKAGALLDRKNIQIEVEEYDLKNLAVKTPSLFIVNQVLDDVDEWVMVELLSRQAVPFRVLVRRAKVHSDHDGYFLPLNYSLLQWEEYVKAIFKQLTLAKSGGYSLVLLLHFTDRSLDTPVRDQFLNRLMRAVMRAEMPVVPVRLKAPFPSFIRPALGTRLIQRNRREPYKVTVRCGSPISVEDQKKLGKPKDFRRYIQSRIFSLGSGLEVKPFFLSHFFQKTEEQEPLAPPVDNLLIINEIARLNYGCLIASQGGYDIFVAEAKDIPHTLQEIGRLREITFRAVGEGTGKASDFDEYDLYYHHLILWDSGAKRLVGGYRMGLGDEIFERYGTAGFYISSLFKIRNGFYPIMRKAVELGRSYITPDYQKKRLPLFLLWKGILYFLLKNPQYRYLYGPVSISKYYSNISRGVIVAYIRKYFFNHELAKYLRPRKPFKVQVDKVDIEMLAGNLGDELTALDSLIEDIEPDHIRIPVLVRQYLKLNARFISFNVDPQFSDVLDGFIILDLNDVPYSMIEALKKESGAN